MEIGSSQVSSAGTRSSQLGGGHRGLVSAHEERRMWRQAPGGDVGTPVETERCGTHQGVARTAAVPPASWRLPREQDPAHSLISDGWPPALGEKSIALSVTLAEGAAAVNHRLAGGVQRDEHADVSPPPRVGQSLPRPQHAGKPGTAAPGKVTTKVSLLEQEEVVQGSERVNRNFQHRDHFSTFSHLLNQGLCVNHRTLFSSDKILRGVQALP